MITLLLIEKIASLFLIMAVGFVLVRLHLLKTGDSKTLSVLSIYAICPCAFISASQVDLTPEVLQGFLFALICSAVLQVGQIVLVKILAKPLHLSPIDQAASVFSNCGNLIIPLVGFVLGDEWVVYSLAYMTVQNILLWTYGKTLISENRHIDVRAVLFNINLLVIAASIVLMVLGIKLVEPLKTFAYDVGQMIGPAAMLVTGMIIGGMNLRKIATSKRVWLVTFIRLVLIPAIIVLVLKLSGIESLVPNGQSILLITLLATITPSASMTVQLAQIYEKDAPHASAINVVTTLCCIVTMPIWVALFMA